MLFYKKKFKKEEICKQFQKGKQTNKCKTRKTRKKKIKKKPCHGWDSNPRPPGSKEMNAGNLFKKGPYSQTLC